MTPLWDADVIVDPDLARDLIETQFPELAPVSARSLAAGWDNTAYLVNGAFVFRFPRREISAPLIHTEIRLLSWLSSRVPLQIPFPEYAGEPSEKYRWSFAGYPLIPGRLLAAARLSNGARSAVAAPLGHFLAALHRLPQDEARRHGAGPDAFDRLNARRRLSVTAERLTTLVDKGLVHDRRSIEAILEAAPVMKAPRSDAVVHGDLHAGQMIVDDDDRLRGIIDWGDVHLGDPAVDLAVAHAILPPASHEMFLNAYGRVDDTSWRAARARATWHTVALLAYASDTDDSDLAVEAQESLVRICRAG